MTTNNGARRVAIIGGGPAGMSCALWLKHLGCRPLIIERAAELGGQALQLDRVNQWVLGSPDKTSRELALSFAAHMAREHIECRFGVKIHDVRRNEQGFVLALSDTKGADQDITAQALVIATGARVSDKREWRNIPGVDNLADMGLMSFFPTDHLPCLDALAGKRVAVIGGGDNAHFTAKDVAARAAHTHLLIRSRSRARAAVRADVESLIAAGKITEHRPYAVESFAREGDVIRIHPQGAGLSLSVDRVFVRAGLVAGSDWLKGLPLFNGLRLDNAGYVMVDAGKRSNPPGIYAIGDVANPEHQAIVIALADGAIAARSIDQDLSLAGLAP